MKTHYERLKNILSRKNEPPSLAQMQKLPVSKVSAVQIENGQMPPPNVIPPELLADFTLHGDVPLLYWYHDERRLGTTPVHNTTKVYERVFQSLHEGNFFYYSDEGKAFFDAVAQYPMAG